jgi:hypothetical protein
MMTIPSFLQFTSAWKCQKGYAVLQSQSTEEYRSWYKHNCKLRNIFSRMYFNHFYMFCYLRILCWSFGNNYKYVQAVGIYCPIFISRHLLHVAKHGIPLGEVMTSTSLQDV